MANTTRLSINITEETARQLTELAQKNDTTVTNIVRRAVGIYSFLDEELADKQRQLQILDRAHDEVLNIAII